MLQRLVAYVSNGLRAMDAAVIRESMEGIKLPEIIVPLIAEAKIVDRWGEAK